VYVTAGDTTIVTALFAGVAPAVLAIVAQAVLRVGGRALGHPALVALAVAAFLALFLLQIPFPVVVAAAAVMGWALGRWAPQTLRASAAHSSADTGPPPLIPDGALRTEQPSRGHSLKVLAVGLIAWGVPVSVVSALTGVHSIFSQQAYFFSGAALVTFGGAYAVLAYVAHQAVDVYGWLGPGDMVRGLALAETTPGPLVMVVQFVAFVGAYRDPGSLDPWAAATLAALLTTWVTFVPCFVFIFLGAPYVERLRDNRPLSAALTGVTAAVVGVIANLAVYFALHTLFVDVLTVDWGPLHLQRPDLATLRPSALLIGAVAAALLLRRRWSVLSTLAVCALLGLLTALPV
jgi:chromate transporter